MYVHTPPPETRADPDTIQSLFPQFGFTLFGIAIIAFSGAYGPISAARIHIAGLTATNRSAHLDRVDGVDGVDGMDVQNTSANRESIICQIVFVGAR